MATLNEIPLSFLQHHSYILHVSTRSDYRFTYGSSKLFPTDFNGTIGEFLDSDIKNNYLSLYSKICREKIDRGRDFRIKDFIIDLYEVTKSQYPFKQFRLYSFFKEDLRPEIYATDTYDKLSLEELFKKADEDTRALIGLNLVVNDQYKECLNLSEFSKVREDDDFLSQLRKFINCYSVYKQALPVRRNNNSQGEFFSRMYQYRHGEIQVPTLEELADEFKRTREGMRIKLKNLINECRSMILENGLDYLLPSSFASRIDAMTSTISSNELLKKEQLISLIGSQVDKKTLAFIINLYNLQELNLGIFGIYYSTRKVSLQDIHKYVASIEDFFSRNPLGTAMHLVKKDCLKKASDDIKAILTTMVEVSPCFTKSLIDEENVFFIKWQYIKNTSERIARLIFEQETHELQLEDIVKAYNERALRSNVPIDPININVVNQRPDLIHSIGRTGLWKLVDKSAPINNEVTGAEDLLKQFLSTLEKDCEFDFNDFKAYLCGRNVTNYSDKSLGAIINSLGYKKKVRGSSIYVQNNIKHWSVRELVEATASLLEKSSNRSLSKTDIKNLLQEKYSRPVNYGTLTNALEQADDLFAQEQVGRSIIVSLLSKRLSDVDFSVYDKVHEYPPYQTAVIQTAIDELSRAKDKSMLMSDLRDIVIKYIPSDIHSNIIYKIFEREQIFKKSDTTPKIISLDLQIYKESYTEQSSMFDDVKSDKNEVDKTTSNNDIEYGYDWNILKEMIISHHTLTFSSRDHNDKLKVLDRMYDIMRGKQSDVFSDSQFWKILDMWYRLYKYPTSCYERELLGTKLILGIENYLENLLSSHNTFIFSDGLVSKINKCQSIGCLPLRDDKEHKINKMIGKLVNIRNRYSHTNNEKYHGDSHVYNTIDLCMRFYIMVAEYDCNLGPIKVY